MSLNGDWKDWPNARWIAALQGQDDEAYEVLISLLYTWAHNVFQYRYRDLDVEELSQQTVINAWDALTTKWSQFKGPGRFLSWARTVLHNEAKQQLRDYFSKRDKLPSISLDELFRQIERTIDEAEHAPEDTAGEQPNEPAQDISEPQAPLSPRLAALQQCMSTLSERYRLSLEQYLYFGTDNAAIAELLGITLNNLNVLRSRARDKLKKCLTDKGFNEASS